MFTSDNIKLSEVIFIWFLALSSTLYPALIEFVGFCFICSFCLFFLLPGMIGLSDLKTILTLSSTSYGCAWLCCVQICWSVTEMVSDRNSYIINMCLTIISLTDVFLGLFLRPVSCF